METNVLNKVGSRCEILTALHKVMIITKGTEHSSYHRVELQEEIEILNFTPYIEQGKCCLLCKNRSGLLLSIPIEWLQMIEL